MGSVFNKHDIIITDKKYYQAICVDEGTVVFAPIKRDKKENCLKTEYKNMFAVSNDKSLLDGFKYEIVKGDDVK